jgi:hypothetical protein
MTYTLVGGPSDGLTINAQERHPNDEGHTLRVLPPYKAHVFCNEIDTQLKAEEYTFRYTKFLFGMYVYHKMSVVEAFAHLYNTHYLVGASAEQLFELAHKKEY